MAGNNKSTDQSERGIPWFLLLIVLLLGLLLWWFSFNPPSSALKKAEVHETNDIPASVESEVAVASPDSNSGSPSSTNRISPPSESFIEISGRVVLRGKRPAERVIAIQQNRDGSQTKKFSRDYEVSDGGGLANVFVYVESGLGGKSFPVPTQILRLTETNEFLEPFMMGTQVDQSIEIENSKRRHQFRMTSSAGSEFAWKRNAEGLMDDPLELVFSGPDIFSRITCKLHDWEWAYFGVLTHPYFAVTDKNGYFKLPKGLQPGSYTIAVQHPKAGRSARSITANQGQKYDLLFRLDAPRPDPNTIAATPVTFKEGESLDEEGGLIAVGSTSPAARDGFSDGAPIIGNESVPSGVVRGQIRLRGTPPPEKPLDVIKNDALCGRVIANVPTTRFYVTGENQGLADTIVYLESEALSKGTFPVRNEPLLLDQVNCEYTPYIAAVQTGQKLLVRNSDPLMHNVHPTPTAPGNRESNKVQMPKAADLEFVYENPETFLRFKCDVHPWMFSYVSVFDHPFFAVTDANGNFSITNVPAGRYQVHAMHRKAGTVSKELVLRGSNGREIGMFLEAK